jgi:hypothetical protein
VVPQAIQGFDIAHNLGFVFTNSVGVCPRATNLVVEWYWLPFKDMIVRRTSFPSTTVLDLGSTVVSSCDLSLAAMHIV